MNPGRRNDRLQSAGQSAIVGRCFKSAYIFVLERIEQTALDKYHLLKSVCRVMRNVVFDTSCFILVSKTHYSYYILLTVIYKVFQRLFRDYILSVIQKRLLFLPFPLIY
ncbi:MAG: hypothetical protein K0Q94_5261 [Paenibacillus sp.]|jgi:hypothetical protein|nr:hypothetical protein [Paenibacillus sp.]